MVLLSKQAYSPVFEHLRHQHVLVCLSFGNVGDWLIFDTLFQLLKHFEIGYTVFAPHWNEPFEDQLARFDWPTIQYALWPGGGNMGNMYSSNVAVRAAITKVLTEKNCPLIILPQTWTSADETPSQITWAREHESIRQFAPHAQYHPDLALAYDPSVLPEEILKHPKYGIGYHFRLDIEKTITPPHNVGDPVALCPTLRDYMALVAQYEEIHTNRLHFAISGLILGARVKMYANAYFKNQAIYEATLKDFEGIEFVYL